MALLPITNASSDSKADKTIAIDCAGTNTVYYTVPAGVSFNGNLVPSNSRYTWAVINGIQIQLDRGADNKQFFYSLTLHSGDAVATAGNYTGWQLIGTEVAL
jgi:hypothetical protein